MIPNYPYFIEESIILTILFGWYHLMLSQEPYFITNRVILWTVVLATTIIPILGINYFPIETKLESINLGNPAIAEVTGSWEWKSVLVNTLIILYTIGVLFNISKILLFLINIYSQISKSNPIKMDGYTLIQTDEIHEPSSFMSYIFTHKTEVSHSVLMHELAHVKARHSWDVIVFSCFRTMFWFHPFSYLLLKALKQNHEFYCDQKVLADVPKEEYCAIILNYKSEKIKPIFINHFSSFIKKRIIMIQQPKPSHFKGLKITTTCILLVLLASIFVLDSYPLIANDSKAPVFQTTKLIQQSEATLDTLPKKSTKNGNPKSKPTKNDVLKLIDNQSIDQMSEEEIIQNYPGTYIVTDTIETFNPENDKHTTKIVTAEFVIAYKMLIEREKRKPLPDQEKMDRWYEKIFVK